MRPVVACHCRQCQRTTGFYMAATAARRGDFVLVEERGLRWYRSSTHARRGFCGLCGSTLFWQGEERDYVAIAAGSLDPPTGLRLVGHIYVESQGDYYTLNDDLPQQPRGGSGVEIPTG